MSLATRLCVPLLVLASSSCVFVVSDDGVHWGGDFRSERGSGVRHEETRSVGEFRTVRLGVPARVEVRVGEPGAVKVAGDDNLVARLETRVSEGVLVVELPGSWSPRCELELVLSTPTLEGFTIEGSGDVVIHNVAGQRLELAIEGSGTVQASGRTAELRGSIEGSGELLLSDLEAGRAELSIEGSGEIVVRAMEGLHYSIEGSGSIVQAGAADPHGKIDGSGSVSRRN